MTDLLFIVNPNAGKNGYRDYLSEVLLTLHKCGFTTTVMFTDGHGDPTRIAETYGARYKRIVCMGGDGTLGETVTGIMHLPPEQRPELGYIPMGTTNDSATTLGLSRDPIQAAYTAGTGRPIPLDIGLFNEKDHFCYVAAYGAFTEVSYETPQDQKNALGRLAYILDGMTRLPNLTHRWCRVEYDGGALEGDFIFGAVTNSRSIAGLIKLKDSAGVSLSDGLFEVLLIRTPESLLQLGPIISDILANKFSSEYVMLLHSKRVKFTFREPVSWTLDGEDGGLQKEVICDNLPHSIQVIVNEAG